MYKVNINSRFYIILDGNVGIYVDTKKDEKMVIPVDSHTFPFPLPRRMSHISIPDKDGGEDLSCDSNLDNLLPSSGKGFVVHMVSLKSRSVIILRIILT